MTSFLTLPEEKRKRILDAFMKECSTKSFKHASTIDIAREANISKGAFFHYFGTKQQAYEYTLDYAMDLVYQMVEDHLPKEEDNLVDLLIGIGQLKVILMKEHPMLFDFLYRMYLEEDPGSSYQAKVEETMSLFQRRIAEQIDTTAFKTDMNLSMAIELATWVSEGIGRKYGSMYPDLDPEHLMEFSLPYMEKLRELIYGDDHEHH